MRVVLKRIFEFVSYFLLRSLVFELRLILNSTFVVHSGLDEFRKIFMSMGSATLSPQFRVAEVCFTQFRVGKFRMAKSA